MENNVLEMKARLKLFQKDFNAFKNEIEQQ
jgi:hypothetical protein